jgi:hypothetical protein
MAGPEEEEEEEEECLRSSSRRMTPSVPATHRAAGRWGRGAMKKVPVPGGIV